MEQVFLAFETRTYLPFQVIVVRLLAAGVLGALVGLEREVRNHPAGLRTHLLVTLAAAVFAILGIEIVHTDQFDSGTAQLDPLRLIEAVTAGVAFLAAGTIIFSRGRVRGLTTGAGMWLSGAVGLACGLGFWHIAALATVLALVVLFLVEKITKKHGRQLVCNNEDCSYARQAEELTTA